MNVICKLEIPTLKKCDYILGVQNLLNIDKV